MVPWIAGNEKMKREKGNKRKKVHKKKNMPKLIGNTRSGGDAAQKKLFCFREGKAQAKKGKGMQPPLSYFVQRRKHRCHAPLLPPNKANKKLKTPPRTGSPPTKTKQQKKKIKCARKKHNITFEEAAAAAACGTSSIGRPLPTSRPGILLPCLPSPSSFRQPRFPLLPCVAPPLPTPLDATHNECLAPRLLHFASSSCHLTMNRSAASRTSRYHLPALFGCSGSQRGLRCKHQRGGVFRGPLGSSERFRDLQQGIYAKLSIVRLVSERSPPGHRREHHPTG